MKLLVLMLGLLGPSRSLPRQALVTLRRWHTQLSPLLKPSGAHFSARSTRRRTNGLLVVSLALVCAGIVAAVAVVAPPGPVSLGSSEDGSDSNPAGGGAVAAGALPGVDGSATSGLLTAALAVAPDNDAAAAPPVVPTDKGALPIGKGMWLWQPEKSEGGNPEAIVAKAEATGLTHIYVRTGSSKMGFYAQQFLNDILPRAHARGIRVYGWDFPYLTSWSADVFRALDAINYTTPDGHRIDGFSADIETKAEGTNITAHDAAQYGQALRNFVGPNYPLIATIPRPSPRLVAAGYPFAEIVGPFDAIAPMVYWMNRDPGSDVAGAMQFLSTFGKPIIPVGQAYDGGPEGGPPGVPPPAQIIRFMQVAEQYGAIGVSFWSWQAANQPAWDAIGHAAEFRLHAGGADGLTGGMVRAYQGLLNHFGFNVSPTGSWDEATAAAVTAYQQAARLPVTGIVDERTRAMLLTPFTPPLQPQQ